jgi:hypothetical protein
VADTRRTISTLTGTTFVDGQTAGSITPQDMRDFIVTAQNAQGSNYVSTAAANTIGTQSVLEIALGTWTLETSPTAYLFSTGGVADERLIYDGVNTTKVLVHAIASIGSATGSETISIGIGKNGTLIANTEVHAATHAITVPTNIMTSTVVEMATSDYVQLFVGNESSSGNITVEYGRLVAVGLVA